jgi:hypothetical protein
VAAAVVAVAIDVGVELELEQDRSTRGYKLGYSASGSKKQCKK